MVACKVKPSRLAQSGLPNKDVSAVIVARDPTMIRHRNGPKYNSLGASGAVAAVIFSAILLVPASS